MVLFTTDRGTPSVLLFHHEDFHQLDVAKNKPDGLTQRWCDCRNEPMEKTCERFIDYIIKVQAVIRKQRKERLSRNCYLKQA
jgi:altronate hydrolase